jgi:hypothetical protein
MTEDNIVLRNQLDQVQEDELETPTDFGREDVQVHEGTDVLPMEEDPVLPDDHTVHRCNRAWKLTRRFLEGKGQEGYELPVSLQAAVYDNDYESFIDNEKLYMPTS